MTQPNPRLRRGLGQEDKAGLLGELFKYPACADAAIAATPIEEMRP